MLIPNHKKKHINRHLCWRTSKQNVYQQPFKHVQFEKNTVVNFLSHPQIRGWSGGAMVLGNLPVPGRPTILITVGQGPIVLAVGAGRGGLDLFTLIYPFSSFSFSLGDGPI